MTLKLTVDSLDGIEEAVAKLYTKDESSGKYILGVEGVPDVTNLKKALSSEREAKEAAAKRAKEVAEAYEGLPEPDELRKLLADLDKNEDAKLIREGKADQIVAKKMERQTAEFNKLLKAAEDRAKAATERVARVNQRIADGIAREAAVKVGIHSHAIDDFILAVRAEGWTLDDKENLVLMDGDGQPVLGKDGKSVLTIDELAESKRETKPHWFPASASGSGAKQGNGQMGGKTMKRTVFDALPSSQKAKVMREGTTLYD